MQLEMLLTQVAEARPDAVFVTSAEVAQLYRTGTSALAWPGQIVCRNYSDGERQIALPVPEGSRPTEALDLRTGSEAGIVEVDSSPALLAPEGDFLVTLEDA